MIRLLTLIFIFFLCLPAISQAQSGVCDPTVPFFVANLTSDPSATYISPAVSRKDNCCGTKFPDRCIEFELHLHPKTGSILFDIYSGAKPTGSMYYQINCGPMIAVGTPICVVGPGPHILTFCKPGSNMNTYSIQAYPLSYSLTGSTAQIGCQTTLTAYGFIDSTIVWRDVTSANGQYDSLLSCTSGCDTTLFTPVPGTPAFVDYEVCGIVIDTVCHSEVFVCDTIRANVVEELVVSVPANAQFCTFNGGMWLYGGAIGGDGNYTYFWRDSTGNLLHSGADYFATSPGYYELEIRDGLYPNCPALFKGINIAADDPAILYAGADTVVCSGTTAVPLSGSVHYAPGAKWSGGAGYFSPSADSLQTFYYPTAGEMAGSVVTLTLTSKTDTLCPVTSIPKKITFNTPIVLTAASVGHVSCFGGMNGSVTLAASGGAGPYMFSKDGGPFQTSILFNNLSAGTYTFTARDSYNCTATFTVTINQPLPLTFGSAAATDVSCNGGSNGTAQITMTGGTPPYSYSWSNGMSQASVSGLVAGTYTVTVQDARGCTRDTVLILNQPLILTATSAVTNVSCNGGSNGTINLTAIGGTAPYTANWSNGLTGLAVQGLKSGTYSYTVTDSRGCKFIGSAALIQPTPLTTTLAGNYTVCEAASTGWISVTASGGISPYTYNWSTGSNSATINGLPGGNYTVTVTDANGCTKADSVFITELIPIVTVSPPDTGLCAPATVIFSASVTGVTVNSVSWDFGDGTSTNTASATHSYLLPGSYVAVFTFTYNNGCTGTATRTILVGEPPTAFAGGDTIVCAGTTAVPLSGSVTYASGGKWSGGNGYFTPSPYSLQAFYHPTAAEMAGSTITIAFTTQPDTVCHVIVTKNITFNTPVVLTASSVGHVSCYGGVNGSVSLAASGGAGPYMFSKEGGPFQTSTLFNNLSAGTYTFTARDSYNCTATLTVTINQPLPLTFGSATAVDVSCFGGSNGSAQVVMTGGTPPYSYSWSNGMSQASISGLTAGTYGVTVQDSKGCLADTSLIINQPLLLTATSSVSNISCFNGSDASITLTATGGTVPYTANWSNGFSGLAVQGLKSGTYSYTVTDSRGCTFINSASLTQPAPLSTTLTGDFSVCEAASDGWISASVTGGVSPYSYNWNTGSKSATVNGLPAGNYSVTATDANGCTITDSVAIIEMVPVVTVSPPDTGICAPATIDFSATITGVTVNSTTWDFGDGTSANTANAVHTYPNPGNYLAVFSFTYEGGCTGTATRTLIIGEPPVVYAGADTAICAGTSIVPISGSVIHAPGAKWSGGNGFFTPSPYSLQAYYHPTAAEMAGSTVVLTFTSQPDTVCHTSITKNITFNTPVVLTATGIGHAACYGAVNGYVQLAASGGTGSYTFSKDGGPFQTSSLFNNLGAGTYNFTARDAFNCEGTIAVTIDEPMPLAFGPASSTDVSCNGYTDGTALVQMAGGTPPYSYIWTTGQAQPSITGLAAGTYGVTVIDAKGCSVDTLLLVNEPVVLSATSAVTNISCYSGSDGTITLSATGGTAPYTASWSNGDTGLAVQGLNTGSYSYTVTDSKGCTYTNSATLTQPAPLSITLAGDYSVCKSAADGWVGATITGGAAPYTYSWNTGSVTDTISGLADGTYSVTATDANGCSISDTVKVTELIPVVTLNLSDSASCPPANISFDAVVNGIDVKSTVWDFGNGMGASTASAFYTYHKPGSYQAIFTYTYGDDCAGTETRTITVHTPPIADAGPDIAICQGDDTTLSGSGGHTYNWTPLIEIINETDPDPTVAPKSTMSYYLTVADTNGCTSTDSVTVVVNPYPVLKVNPDTSICDGKTVQLLASGADFYEWSATPNTSLSCTGCPDPVTTPASSTTYSVIGSNSHGCANKDSVVVQVNPLPKVGVVQGQVTCSNTPVDLLASGGTTYIWSPAELLDNFEAPNPKASPKTTTVFSVLVYNQYGCSGGDSTTVQVKQAPGKQETVSEEICFGESIGLMASDGDFYSWSPSGSLSCDTCKSTVASPLETTLYIATISNSNGCISRDSFLVEVNPLPEISIIAGNPICKGDSIRLIASSEDAVTISWSPLYKIQNPNTAKPIVSPDTSTVYTVTVEDSKGCKNSKNLTVDVIEEVVAHLDDEIQICLGEAAQLFVDVVQHGQEIITYRWYPFKEVFPPNVSNPAVKPETTSTYMVVINNGECKPDTQTVQVVVNPLPEVTANEGGVVVQGTVVELSAYSPTAIAFNWFPEENVECSYCASSSAVVTEAESFTVFVEDENGCKNFAEVQYRVRKTCGDMFFVPNTFTPNGDKKNDKFFVRNYGMGELLVFRVFNRWGELVFETNDINHGWDGYFRDMMSNNDVFVWYIEAKCGEGGFVRKHGNVTVIR